MGQTPELGADQVGHIDEIQFGTQADRPVNPHVGLVWISSDTKKFWACFVTNVWTHMNPIDLSGASDADFFAYDGVTGFLVPKTVSALQYGLEADLPANPDVGWVYMATDTEIVYYCFEDDVWTPTYLPRSSIVDWEKDDIEDLQPVNVDGIFESDEYSDLMPSVAGETDQFYEIVGGEITTKV
jgi:hypothetical protein